MKLTSFLKSGIYLSLKVGFREKEVYSIFSKEDLGQKYFFNNANKYE
ncbi:TPA: hypothetical protein ACKRZV_003787 [Proteus mirabilis]|nr:hypothetical protein [Proteus mirabilis]